MTEEQDVIRELATLPVPLAGALQATGDPWEPYRIIDAGGEPVAAVAEFFRELQAAGRSEATLRSYGHDLLRWFRFIWAAGVPWNRATRTEASARVAWSQGTPIAQQNRNQRSRSIAYERCVAAGRPAACRSCK